MQKCHTDHVKITPKSTKVTVRFDEDFRWHLFHLANKYSGGCQAKFIKENIESLIKQEYLAEIEGDLKAENERRGKEKTSGQAPSNT